MGGRKHAACPASDNCECPQLRSPLGWFWGISLRPDERKEKTIPDLIDPSAGSEQRPMSTVSKKIATRRIASEVHRVLRRSQMSLT